MSTPIDTTRGLSPTELAELSNLWHLSATAVGRNKYDRRIWACKWFHDAHPEHSTTKAYKVLDASPWT